ncbi:MAG: hypothetical protein M1828_004960 [Chrysothrix sp. TS-e1954]|nr:MAG: hypothetical protein M1828_004960 [Chrysothrix sp. TS-e1954]
MSLQEAQSEAVMCADPQWSRAAYLSSLFRAAGSLDEMVYMHHVYLAYQEACWRLYRNTVPSEMLVGKTRDEKTTRVGQKRLLADEGEGDVPSRVVDRYYTCRRSDGVKRQRLRDRAWAWRPLSAICYKTVSKRDSEDRRLDLPRNRPLVRKCLSSIEYVAETERLEFERSVERALCLVDTTMGGVGETLPCYDAYGADMVTEHVVAQAQQQPASNAPAVDQNTSHQSSNSSQGSVSSSADVEMSEPTDSGAPGIPDAPETSGTSQPQQQQQRTGPRMAKAGSSAPINVTVVWNGHGSSPTDSQSSLQGSGSSPSDSQSSTQSSGFSPATSQTSSQSSGFSPATSQTGSQGSGFSPATSQTSSQPTSLNSSTTSQTSPPTNNTSDNVRPKNIFYAEGQPSSFQQQAVSNDQAPSFTGNRQAVPQTSGTMGSQPRKNPMMLSKYASLPNDQNAVEDQLQSQQPQASQAKVDVASKEQISSKSNALEGSAKLSSSTQAHQSQTSTGDAQHHQAGPTATSVEEKSEGEAAPKPQGQAMDSQPSQPSQPTAADAVTGNASAAGTGFILPGLGELEKRQSQPTAPQTTQSSVADATHGDTSLMSADKNPSQANGDRSSGDADMPPAQAASGPGLQPGLQQLPAVPSKPSDASKGSSSSEDRTVKRQKAVSPSSADEPQSSQMKAADDSKSTEASMEPDSSSTKALSAADHDVAKISQDIKSVTDTNPSPTPDPSKPADSKQSKKAQQSRPSLPEATQFPFGGGAQKDQFPKSFNRIDAHDDKYTCQVVPTAEVNAYRRARASRQPPPSRPLIVDDGLDAPLELPDKDAASHIDWASHMGVAEAVDGEEAGFQYCLVRVAMKYSNPGKPTEVLMRRSFHVKQPGGEAKLIKLELEDADKALIAWLKGPTAAQRPIRKVAPAKGKGKGRGGLSNNASSTTTASGSQTATSATAPRASLAQPPTSSPADVPLPPPGSAADGMDEGL